MTKGLIVVVLAWTCQVALGSEITILEAQLQKGDPIWGLYREIGSRAVNTFCFDEKLFIASFAAKNLRKVTPIMGNAPEGLGQQECPHKEFQLLDGISFKDTRAALGLKGLKRNYKNLGIFTICVSDVRLYWFQQTGQFVQIYEAGRAVACSESQPG